MSRSTTPDAYDSGLLVGPPDEVTAQALTMAVHDDEVGDLLMALLGWDQAVQSLSSSPSPRGGRVLTSIVSWLLVS